MTERTFRRGLLELPLPDAGEAEERALAVVRQAFAEREPVAWPRRHARPLLAAALAAAVVAAVASPPGRAVVNSIRDAVGREQAVGVQRSAPALLSLPAAGRVLVTAPSGPWIVQRDGAKRRLGAYSEAAWSPHGLFVAAASGRQLVALDPHGNVRWTITRRRPVHDASWSSDGYRIAYRTGSALHVVAGDSTRDRVLAPQVAPVAPAWRPGVGHVLGYVDPAGRITTVAADESRVLWRSGRTPARRLRWSPDGRSLLAAGPRSMALYDADGTRVRTFAGPGFGSAAFSPDGQSLAVVRRSPQGSTLWLYPTLRSPTARRIFTGAGFFSALSWSPDGRWLLLGWRTADQWLFIRVARPQKLLAVSDIARQFNPGARRPGAFPALDGWCCFAAGRAG